MRIKYIPIKSKFIDYKINLSLQLSFINIAKFLDLTKII